MKIQEVLGDALRAECPFIHDKRLNAVLDVADVKKRPKLTHLSPSN